MHVLVDELLLVSKGFELSMGINFEFVGIGFVFGKGACVEILEIEVKNCVNGEDLREAPAVRKLRKFIN